MHLINQNNGNDMAWKPCRSSGIVEDKLRESLNKNRSNFYNHDFWEHPTFDNLKKLSSIAARYINSHNKFYMHIFPKSHKLVGIDLFLDRPTFISCCQRNLDKISPNLKVFYESQTN